MSNALRIDFDEGSFHEYMIFSHGKDTSIDMVLIGKSEEDTEASICREDVQDLADYLLAWLDKNGGQP